MTERFPARMHDVTDETRAIVDLVLEYSRQRLLAVDTPLDKPLHYEVSKTERPGIQQLSLRFERRGDLTVFELDVPRA